MHPGVPRRRERDAYEHIADGAKLSKAYVARKDWSNRIDTTNAEKPQLYFRVESSSGNQLGNVDFLILLNEPVVEQPS